MGFRMVSRTIRVKQQMSCNRTSRWLVRLLMIFFLWFWWEIQDQILPPSDNNSQDSLPVTRIQTPFLTTSCAESSRGKGEREEKKYRVPNA